LDCCDIYTDQFDEETATRHAQQYRKKGLDGASGAMLGALVSRGITGTRVVEFGGGVGGLSLELIKAGVAEAVNVELSLSYRKAALALAHEAGLADRIDLVAGDAIEVVGEVGPADIVVMHRVVCCYANGEELMQAGMRTSHRLLGVSYPSVHPGTRSIVAVENRLRARRGSAFRSYVHPQSVIALPGSSGFEQVFRRRRPAWGVRVWERRSA
jgi:magnesium-protoporphyrin O-methyltransferase